MGPSICCNCLFRVMASGCEKRLLRKIMVVPTFLPTQLEQIPTLFPLFLKPCPWSSGDWHLEAPERSLHLLMTRSSVSFSFFLSLFCHKSGLINTMNMNLGNPGDGEGQGGLACYSPWGRKASDTTGQLNNEQQQASYLIFLC